MIKRGILYLWLGMWLPYIGASPLLAQNKSLEQCFTKLLKARNLVTKSTPANQTMFLLFDSTDQKYRQVHQDWAKCVEGQPIPKLSFQTLDGQSYDSSSLAGKILVINFWFMGCVPCQAEMPALNRLVSEYKGKKVLFLGFATDPASRLKTAFVPKNRFDFTLVGDASKIASLFHFFGYPTTYVVDQSGVIRKVWNGGVDLSELAPYYKAKEAIDNLLTSASR